FPHRRLPRGFERATAPCCPLRRDECNAGVGGEAAHAAMSEDMCSVTIMQRTDKQELGSAMVKVSVRTNLLLILFGSMFAASLQGQTTHIDLGERSRPAGKAARANLTASRCRAEILSLKDRPSSYFERLSKNRLRYLYALAGDCGDTTVAGLSVEELDENYSVYSRVEKLLNGE